MRASLPTNPLGAWPAALAATIAETAAWCLPRLDPSALRTCWRSEELRPKHLEPTRRATVGAVIRQRAQQGAGQSAITTGRLLAYFPDAELSDGAAEVETQGFFDVFNEPPWDCWVAWAETRDPVDLSYRSFLVAWIPPGLYALVDRAIAANPEECIQWLDQLPAAYRAALEQP